MMRSRADLSPHLQPPSLSSTPHESLDSSICKLSCMFMCLFFFSPFLVLHSQKVISAALGVWKEAPAAFPVFPLHLAAPTEAWLCQLDLHTGGSLCHPVKRSGGIRVLACNSLHNTDTCAFLYNRYPLLYLGYFSPCVECFSHTHTQMCVSWFQHSNDPASLVCSICFFALQQHRATVKPA